MPFEARASPSKAVKFFSKVFENAMSVQGGHLYEFGEFRLDTTSRRLLRGREIVSLTPKVWIFSSHWWRVRERPSARKS
jgi:hypothetical protein